MTQCGPQSTQVVSPILYKLVLPDEGTLMQRFTSTNSLCPIISYALEADGGDDVSRTSASEYFDFTTIKPDDEADLFSVTLKDYYTQFANDYFFYVTATAVGGAMDTAAGYMSVHCEDDWSWADDDGDQCDWYDWNADSCGLYGSGASDACCACGGGIVGGNWSEDSWGSCEDDWSWADSYGDQCDWYDSNPDSCGAYGEGAWDACCACGGGIMGDDASEINFVAVPEVESETKTEAEYISVVEEEEVVAETEEEFI